ncbi:MAG: hypothetical protein KAH48_06940, partial [Chlorobi bacterium]|nr:hypothetical protein [Chlorobiota bacterium]
TGSKSVVVSGNEKNVKVRISGISIGTVDIGDPDPNSTKTAKTTVKLSGAKVSVDGYELNGTPTFEENDGKYSIYFELAGKLARGEDMLTGSVSVSMMATAINPLNGKASKQSKKKIKAMINFEPEKTTRRRGGGATRRRR